jgi:hypothetical protein
MLLQQSTGTHLTWSTGAGVKQCKALLNTVKSLLMLMTDLHCKHSIFPLNKLKCWGPGWINCLTALRPFPGVPATCMKDYQPSSQPYCPHASPAVLTLEEATGQPWMLANHNSFSRRHCLSHDYFKLFVLNLLPSQALVNSRWPC